MYASKKAADTMNLIWDEMCIQKAANDMNIISDEMCVQKSCKFLVHIIREGMRPKKLQMIWT